MGGGHSIPQKAPPVPISIPQFPYPPNILQYLLSQSAGLKITYVPPGSSTASTIQTTQGDSSGTTPEATPSTWVEATLPPMYSGGFPPGSTTPPVPIGTMAPTPTPTIALQPAYSDPTLPPHPSKRHFRGHHKPHLLHSKHPTHKSHKSHKSHQQNKSTTTKTTTTTTPATPLIWKAAIEAMEYIKKIKVIKTGDQMNTFYNDLQNAISTMLQKSSIPSQNAATLIYLCTVITVAFQPFNKFISYNYLSHSYPTIFKDSAAYRKFCMVNFYSIQASQLLTKNKVLNQYIPVNNRVMQYMVPPLLQSILYELQQ